MRKLLLLLCLVVTGFGNRAMAWNNVYLNDDTNNWGNNGISQFFTVVSGTDNNTFYYNLDASKITSNDYYFRIYADSHIYPITNGAEVSETPCSETGSTNESTNNAFKIAQNPNAKFVQIKADYNNGDGTWKWYISATIWSETAQVAFVNIGNWSEIHAYTFDGLGDAIHTLGEWNTTSLSETNGIYTIDVPYTSTTKIIFNGKDGDNSIQTKDLDFKANGVYDKDGLKESVSAPIGAAGFATFSSAYPVDFTNVSDVTAYRATLTDDSKVLLTKVDGKVPAATGLLLKGTANSNYTISTTIATESIGDNLLKATTVETTVAASKEGAYHYFLAGSDNSTIGFYNLASEANSAAGKAYLETTTALASETNGSRSAWLFADETTAISDNTVSLPTKNNVFDLQGRRVSNPSKGLYIINGKKVMR